METETPTTRAASAGGSALPLAAVEQRGALMRYAATLLEGGAVQAGEVVDGVLAQVAAEAGSGGAVADGAGERTGEKLFAAVRREALARLRREGRVQRAAAAESDAPAASVAEEVERLTPKQREAVGLKFAHGFGYESIASITGLSVRNIAFLLHLAVTHLREVATRDGVVVAADDTRVTDFVLDEMKSAERAAFEEEVKRSDETKRAVKDVRRVVGELRAALASGDSGATRVKMKRRRSGAAWWRAKWFYGGLLATMALGGGVWWFTRERVETTASAAGEVEEFRLKPDAWKSTREQARAGEAARGGPTGAVPGSGSRASVRASGSAVGGTRTEAAGARVIVEPGDEEKNRAEALKAKPADEEARVILAAAGGGGGTGAVGAGTAAVVAESGAGSGPSPEAAVGAPGAGQSGRGEEKSAAGGAGKSSGAEAAVQGGAKPGTLPMLPGGAGRPVAVEATKDAAGKAAANEGGGKFTERGKGDADRAARAAAREGPPGTDDGTADVATLRAALAAKRWPAAGAVGARALADYFASESTGSVAEPGVTTAVEVAEAPWAPERRLVRVVVRAAPRKTPRRATANVVLLVDVSRSMDGPNRLPLVQEAARRLLRDLRPEDRVAIVTYAGEAHVALASTPMTRAAEVRAALGALQADGMTNGAAGLQRAYALARAGFIAGGVNRVVLCTDGDFNMGVTSETELAALVENEAKGGVALAVFGFGRGRAIDPRLELLATKGRGASGNVNTRREAERRIAAEVNGWSATEAREVRVEFTCDPARVAACRLVGYDENFLPPEDAGRRSVKAGELAPGEALTALFEIEPREDGAGGRSARGESGRGAAGVTLSVGYTEVASGERRTRRVPVAEVATRWTEASAEFKFSAAVAGLGLALREVPPSAERLAAVVRWAEEAAAARGASGSDDPGGYREEFLALAREARELAK